MISLSFPLLLPLSLSISFSFWVYLYLSVSISALFSSSCTTFSSHFRKAILVIITMITEQYVLSYTTHFLSFFSSLTHHSFSNYLVPLSLFFVYINLLCLSLSVFLSLCLFLSIYLCLSANLLFFLHSIILFQSRIDIQATSSFIKVVSIVCCRCRCSWRGGGLISSSMKKQLLPN